MNPPSPSAPGAGGRTMAFIEFRDVSYTYPGQKRPALQNISFSLETGRHLAVVGGNGSGKSTLTRLIMGLIVPDSGTVLVDGKDSSDRKNHRAIRTRVGLVFQNPSTQIVATVVREDIAFGPENLNLDGPEIRQRVAKALDESSLSPLAKRETHMLSAGQQQRLAMAGVLAMGTGCLILDEAESMLNPAGRNQLNSLLDDLHSRGFTIIRITHFMEQASRAQDLLLLHKGDLVSFSSPRLFLDSSADLERWFLKPSALQSLAYRLSSRYPGLESLLREEDLIQALKEETRGQEDLSSEFHSSAGADSGHSGEPVMVLENISRAYGARGPSPVQALKNVSFKLAGGEAVALMGTTGSGKSTFLQTLNSLLLPDSGSITILGENPLDKKCDLASLRTRVGLVMQQPEKQLFASLIGDDVAFGPQQMGVRGRDLAVRVRDALEKVGLNYKEFRDHPVRALSGGQKRKAALAGVLAMTPEILLLDEPTAGLDPLSAENLETIIRDLHKGGLTVLTVTHSVEQALRLSSRLLVFREGELAYDGGTAAFFRNHDPLDFGLDLPLSGRIGKALGLKDLPVTPDELCSVLGVRENGEAADE